MGIGAEERREGGGRREGRRKKEGMGGKLTSHISRTTCPRPRDWKSK